MSDQQGKGYVNNPTEASRKRVRVHRSCHCDNDVTMASKPPDDNPHKHQVNESMNGLQTISKRPECCQQRHVANLMIRIGNETKA